MLSSTHTAPQVDIAISRLSFDLFGEIFAHCLPDKIGTPSAKVAPLLLCHVCSAWRATACALPELWDTLFFQFSDDESNFPQLKDVIYTANLARLWFANIKISSLSLYIQWYGGMSLQLLEDVVISHSSQLRKLDLFFCSNTEFGRFFTLPPGLVDRLEHLSLSLEYSSKYDIATMTVFQSAPRLRKAQLSNIRKKWIYSPSSDQMPIPLAQLTHLDLRMSLAPKTWRALLRHCVRLERCILLVVFGEAAAADTSVDQKTMEMRHLVDLSVYSTRPQRMEHKMWFHGFSFPVLDKLDIRYAFLNPVLLDAIDASLPLSSLRCLALKEELLHVEGVISLLRATTSVVELSLRLENEGGIQEPDSDFGLLWDTLTHFPDRPARALPRLEILAISSDVEVDSVETATRCLSLIESRWGPSCSLPSSHSGVARLCQISLHFSGSGQSFAKEIKTRLKDADYDGLSIYIQNRWNCGIGFVEGLCVELSISTSSVICQIEFAACLAQLIASAIQWQATCRL